MYPSLIEIGSKTAEKNSAQKQTDKQTDRQTNIHYENKCHLLFLQQFPPCGRSRASPLFSRTVPGCTGHL